MSFLYDDLEQHPDTVGMRGDFQGIVTDAPATVNDRVAVTLPGFSTTQKFAGCRWARDGENLPARGDICLCTFDDLGELWIAVWWPS